MTPPDEMHPERSSRPVQPAAHDDLGFALPGPAKLKRGRGLLLSLLAVCLLAGAFLVGYLPRRESQQALARTREAEAQAMPQIDVVIPKLLESGRELVLPGSIQALASTVLYPRANGYIERFEADIGDRVQAGQLLAVIETPELDQQLDQARAQLTASEASLAQARASGAYAKTSLERYQRLQPSGVASQQELDQRGSEAQVSEANVAVASAAIEVQKAELRRLTRVKSFARVTAPFAGLISERSIEVGSLVTAGNASPLFRLISTDPVRVMLQVPQDVAPSVRAGVKAQIRVREYAGREFEGELSRAAFALDAQTRTMLTEVRVPNPEGELLVGMYAEIALSLPVPHRVYEVPATALYNDAQGLRLAVVDSQNKLQFVRVTLERDTGATVQVATGLKGDERVVRIASSALQAGALVLVREK